jgi:hypothetical protein
VVTSNIDLNYFLLIFVALVGMLQIAVTYAGIKGLSFFKHKILGYIFGVLLVGGAYWWFFSGVDLQRRYLALEGKQQFGIAVGGAFLAIVFTFLLSSLINRRAFHSSSESKTGFEELKEKTFIEAIISTVKNIKKISR